MHTHRCEFCNVIFYPRPQVKHPRACKDCQKARQRANEREWHLANGTRYSRKYHRIKKILRIRKLREMAQELCRFLRVGKTFLGEPLDFHMAEAFFYQFLTSVGIRRANKLWMV